MSEKLSITSSSVWAAAPDLAYTTQDRSTTTMIWDQKISGCSPLSSDRLSRLTCRAAHQLGLMQNRSFRCRPFCLQLVQPPAVWHNMCRRKAFGWRHSSLSLHKMDQWWSRTMLTKKPSTFSTATVCLYRLEPSTFAAVQSSMIATITRGGGGGGGG